MIYDTYEIYKNKYYNAQSEYDKILSEKENLFNRTQPKATDYNKERVNGGKPVNAFDEYLVQKEKKNIDERLQEAKSIMEERANLLELKEQELRLSKDWNDIIYVYSVLERLSIRKIEKKLIYKYDYPLGKSEIHRKLEIIRKNINLGQNRTKGIVK